MKLAKEGLDSARKECLKQENRKIVAQSRVDMLRMVLVEAEGDLHECERDCLSADRVAGSWSSIVQDEYSEFVAPLSCVADGHGLDSSDNEENWHLELPNDGEESSDDIEM
jgi:hypothetical protein